MWFNYKAFTLSTPLSGNNIMETTGLEAFICDIGANSSMYHCYYDLEKRPSFVNYEGLARPVFNTIHLDLDSKDDEGLRAWEDTKKLCIWLQTSNVDYVMYFSGNKGFHVAVHMSAFGLSAGPVKELEAKVKNILVSLHAVYPSLDTGIWNANRKFRAYRSQHEKSKLYKIRLPSLDLTLPQIRNRALTQPESGYVHPAPAVSPLQFTATIPQPQALKKQYKEASLGAKEDDSSLQFKSFLNKLCIKDIEARGSVPSLNRHDVGLRLIYDMFHTGVSFTDASARLDKWAMKVFGTESDRIADMRRQLSDAYSDKPQTYNFGCYDDVKKVFCSAKCKLYNNLDRKKRPEPIDCTKAQRTENEIRRDPLSDLSEGMIADEILSKLPNIRRCDGDYFWWVTTHWERLDRDRFEEKIHEACIRAYSNKAPNRILESLFNQIKKKLPVAPENNCLFKTSPNKFNFKDGTCHVHEDAKGKVTLEMKPHNPEDYISYCAPFPLYGDHDLPRAETHDFEHFMQAKVKHIGADNVRILKQLMGAALIPYRPKIFFLIGEKDSGKSTHAMLLMKLLGQKNISVIDPVKEKGQRFTWEEAIGKIANFSLELPHDSPLDTNNLKKVRDKMELDIERKGIKKVRARLPFLHVYCANKMPPSLEGNTGALASRFIIVEYPSIGKEDLNGLSGITNLADHCWEYDAGAVLDWAREGLAELIESNFQYFTPDSSRQFLRDWEKENDSVSLFLEDCSTGEFKLNGIDGVDGRADLLGQHIYNGYLRWAQEAGIQGKLKRVKFYDYLKKKPRIPFNNRADGGIRFEWPYGVLSQKVESGIGAHEKTKNAEINARF